MSLFTYPNSFPVRSAFGPHFYGVSRLHDDIDRLFGGFFGQPAGEDKNQAEPACLADFLPGMDLASSDKAYALRGISTVSTPSLKLAWMASASASSGRESLRRNLP